MKPFSLTDEIVNDRMGEALEEKLQKKQNNFEFIWREGLWEKWLEIKILLDMPIY